MKNHTTGEDIGIASPPNHWLRCGVFSFGAGVQRLGLTIAWFAVLASGTAQSTNTPPEDAKPTTAKLPTRDRLEDELRWLRAEWVTVDTVQSASKYEQSVADAPASVTIITDDEIRRFGHRTLAEVLNSVRGFNLTYDRNYHYLGVRGFGRPGDFNSRVLMLVDGHRVNDVVYDGAAIGTDSPVPADICK
ncbi:MAG: TonB-dependent receptor plug domain-containing protein [Limisphaerales bacterium]